MHVRVLLPANRKGKKERETQEVYTAMDAIVFSNAVLVGENAESERRGDKRDVLHDSSIHFLLLFLGDCNH